MSALPAPIARDPYLERVAREHPTHAMLAGATGLVYERQVERIVRSLTRDCVHDPAVEALDWGCGKGHITYLLRRHGLNVTSCDIESDANDSTFGQETPIVDDQAIRVIPLVDAVRLPFPDASFDLVTSFGVLEHVKDDAASLREIRRVLRPGGLFFCSFLPYRGSWTQLAARLAGDGYHDRLYSKAHARALFNDAGLLIRSLEHEQLLPKNTWRWNLRTDRFDQMLCRLTPLRLIATNLVVAATVSRR